MLLITAKFTCIYIDSECINYEKYYDSSVPFHCGSSSQYKWQEYFTSLQS